MAIQIFTPKHGGFKWKKIPKKPIPNRNPQEEEYLIWKKQIRSDDNWITKMLATW